MTELTLDNEMRRKYLRLHLSIMTADRLGTLLRLTGGQGDHESPGQKIFHLHLSQTGQAGTRVTTRERSSTAGSVLSI